MIEPSPRFWEIFFELFEALPRQGPGNLACTKKALDLCRDLPPSAEVLDLGCGAGGQTIYLAELTSGTITAIDMHTAFIEKLMTTIAERNLAERICPMVADVMHTGLPPGSFDLVWSEGAFFMIGIENALRLCHGLLRPGGYLAFSDAVWRKDDPPAEVKEAFLAEHWVMGWPEQNIALIGKNGFSLLGHFAFPAEAWWDDFYTPFEYQLQELRTKYTSDNEALAILERLAAEPEMHRKYSDYYGYEFFVARKEH